MNAAWLPNLMLQHYSKSILKKYLATFFKFKTLNSRDVCITKEQDNSSCHYAAQFQADFLTRT